MAVLTAQKADTDGIEPTFVNADEQGDIFLKTGQVIIYLKNDSASDITVTIISQVQNVPPGMARQDKAIFVKAGRETIIGNIDDAYADMSGYVHLSYSDVNSLLIAIFRI